MARTPLPHLLIAVFLVVWLAACYGLRYGLMEDVGWVDLCTTQNIWQCHLRAQLGQWIHFGVAFWIALPAALCAFILPGAWGRAMALMGLFFAFPAIALYNATPGIFALVISALRLVRKPRSLAQSQPQTTP